MRSLNKTVILLFFSLIKIVCVTCMTDCENEILEEFKNGQPLDDFLHAFLSINQQINRGYVVLKNSVKGYYNDLFTNALENGIPEILSPQYYCSTEHEDEGALLAIGCRENYNGADCFKKMYFGWSMNIELYNSLPGTEDLSDEELLTAIYKGSEQFRDLSDEDLFEAFSSLSYVFYYFTDEYMLQEYYRKNYENNHILWEDDKRRPNSSCPNRSDDFYGRSAYNDFLKRSYKDSDQKKYRNNPQLRKNFDKTSLYSARLSTYGHSFITYETICKEYQRRKTLPKYYDDLYAMDICKRIRNSNWECEKEILEEFDNDQPLDDFLHAFLNIKYDRVYWDANTNINEQIYRGNGDLKKAAKGYYNELFNIALELGIPEILSPQNYCSTEHEGEEYDCRSALLAIGCRDNYSGADCFEKMYYSWSINNDVYNSLPGTKDLSDEELLTAIYQGSEQFRDLSDKDLFEAFSSRSYVFYYFTDEYLLQEYYRKNYEENHILWEDDAMRPNSSCPSRSDDFYGWSAFNEFVKRYYKKSDQLNYRNNPQLRINFDKTNLYNARLRTYGHSLVSYETICKEYQRRKTLPKYYDDLYAMDICERIRSSTWDTSNFKNYEDFCEKYNSEQGGN